MNIKSIFFQKTSLSSKRLINLMSLLLIRDSNIKVLIRKNFYFNWGIIWDLLSPLLIVAGFAFLVTLGLRDRQIEYFLFMLLFWFGFQQTATNLIKIEIPDFLLNIPGSKPHLVIISRYLVNMIGLLIRFVVCVLVLEFFGFKIPISYMVLAYILIAIFSFSYAIILSTLMHEMLFLKELHQYFLTFLFFTSSILIPVPLLPEPIRGILLYNPLVHYFEWIKVPVTNVEYSFIDINYFLSFSLIMFLLSPLFLFYKQKNYL